MGMTRMKVVAGLVLAAGLGVSAGLHSPSVRAQPRPEETAPAKGEAAPPQAPLVQLPKGERPTIKQLIATLNDHTRHVQVLRCNNVSIDVRDGDQSIGFGGGLVYQKPARFRLIAKVLGRPAFDLGGNEKEVWYWSHKVGLVRFDQQEIVRGTDRPDIARGTSRWPFPFAPDALLDALGLVEHDPAKHYQVAFKSKTIELIEPVVTPRGQRLCKVTVFARGRDPIQVSERRLEDEKGKEICRAVVDKVHQDTRTGAMLVEQVTLSWPAQRLEVRLQLHDMQIAAVSNEPTGSWFTLTVEDLQRMSRRSGPAAEGDRQPVLAAGTIRIDLTNAGLVMSHGEDEIKVSGRPDGELALRLLKDQVRKWTADGERKTGVWIHATGAVEYALLKAVLDACREAGVRKIEVRTADKAAESGASRTASVRGQLCSTQSVAGGSDHSQSNPSWPSSGPGRLRRAGRVLERQATYVLDDYRGLPILYAGGSNVDLAPYLNRNVELFGPIVFRGDLRANFMTVMRVRVSSRPRGDKGGDRPMGVLAAYPGSPPDAPGSERDRGQEQLPPVKIVKDREVKLKFEASKVGPAGLAGVQVYVTLDDGAKWEPVRGELPVSLPVGDGRSAGPLRGSVTVRLEREGAVYGFFVVVKSKAGLDKPPRAGDPPQMRLELDITAPKAALFRPQPDANNPNSLVLAWTASDAHLTANPITLEWSQTKDGPWLVIGEDRLPNVPAAASPLPERATGSFTWRLPERAPAHVYFKLTVRDMAGNLAVAQTDKPVLIDLSVPEIKSTGVAPGR